MRIISSMKRGAWGKWEGEGEGGVTHLPGYGLFPRRITAQFPHLYLLACSSLLGGYIHDCWRVFRSKFNIRPTSTPPPPFKLGTLNETTGRHHTYRAYWRLRGALINGVRLLMRRNLFGEGISVSKLKFSQQRQKQNPLTRGVKPQSMKYSGGRKSHFVVTSW